MPFDLMRHDLLMTLTAVPPERIVSIVDDLFLPLAAQYRPPPDRRAERADDKTVLNGR